MFGNAACSACPAFIRVGQDGRVARVGQLCQQLLQGGFVIQPSCGARAVVNVDAAVGLGVRQMLQNGFDGGESRAGGQ